MVHTHPCIVLKAPKQLKHFDPRLLASVALSPQELIRTAFLFHAAQDVREISVPSRPILTCDFYGVGAIKAAQQAA